MKTSFMTRVSTWPLCGVPFAVGGPSSKTHAGLLAAASFARSKMRSDAQRSRSRASRPTLRYDRRNMLRARAGAAHERADRPSPRSGRRGGSHTPPAPRPL